MPDKQPSAAIIDEYGELSRQLAEYHARIRPVLDRAALIEGQFRRWFDNLPAEQSFTQEGTHYLVQVGAREYRRTVSKMGALFKRLGRQLFLELAYIPLKAIDEHIPEAEQERYLTKERSGPRTIIAVAKAKKSAA